MSVLNITEENFEQEVLQAKQPVLLDFFAAWCGPCAALAPVIDGIAARNPDLKVGKVDVDAQKALARRHKVLSVPTLMVFRDGAVTARASGVRSEEDILAMTNA